MFRSITFVTAMICILGCFTNAFQTTPTTSSIANSRSNSMQLGMIFGELLFYNTKQASAGMV